MGRAQVNLACTLHVFVVKNRKERVFFLGSYSRCCSVLLDTFKYSFLVGGEA